MNRRTWIVLACVLCWFAYRWQREPSRAPRRPESPLLSIAVLPADTAGAELPRAQDVLANVARVYASCERYRDEGVNWTEFIGDGESGRDHQRETQFATRFDRRRGFRWEYRELEAGGRDDTRMVIWGLPERAQEWWTVREHAIDSGEWGSLRAAAAGVSSGTSTLIPDLLDPQDERDALLLRLVEPIVRGRDDVGGRPCYRIEAQLEQAHAYVVWVDVEQYVVRRVHESFRLDDCRVDETIVCAPELDPRIADDELAFTPP
ncbi:MAG: hypothetical protein EPO68_08140 [Planctomycetota bacterium]|nr:MAG: hypothetical protein EPO68_08140 [Planctomycetota bacterium]